MVGAADFGVEAAGLTTKSALEVEFTPTVLTLALGETLAVRLTAGERWVGDTLKVSIFKCSS